MTLFQLFLPLIPYRYVQVRVSRQKSSFQLFHDSVVSYLQSWANDKGPKHTRNEDLNWGLTKLKHSEEPTSQYQFNISSVPMTK